MIGAARNRIKYGNKVLRCYLQHGKTVFSVNPRADEIEGISCASSISDLPETVKSISVITPPPVTMQVIREAIAKGITSIWMQPGAESAEAIESCIGAGINVIGDGSCILRHLGFQDH